MKLIRLTALALLVIDADCEQLAVSQVAQRIGLDTSDAPMIDHLVVDLTKASLFESNVFKLEQQLRRLFPNRTIRVDFIIPVTHLDGRTAIAYIVREPFTNQAVIDIFHSLEELCQQTGLRLS